MVEVEVIDVRIEFQYTFFVFKLRLLKIRKNFNSKMLES